MKDASIVALQRGGIRLCSFLIYEECGSRGQLPARLPMRTAAIILACSADSKSPPYQRLNISAFS